MLVFLLACADGECADENTAESRGACCVEAFGRGIEDPDDLERLEESCPECDPDAYVSADAAICAA